MDPHHLLSRWLQTQWYAKSVPNPLLLPLEALYRKAVARRRRAYDERGRKQERLPVPVIVVGNLTVGGTGKTPLTIWLASFLKRQGFHPGIVSRGYGGAASGAPLAVTAETDPRLGGDEPVLIARRSACPVFVCPQRLAAGRALLAATDCDLIVADDGLQHYALARDIEIAVVDGVRGFGNGHCLPAGPLREPPERLRSVDLVVYNGEAPAGAYSMALAGAEAVSLVDGCRRSLSGFAGQTVYALAGIGNPERFFHHLRAHGLSLGGCRDFPDHHDYREPDLGFAGCAPLLMTEKDAVKCRCFAGPEHWYVPVEAHLPAEFGERLLTLLKVKRDAQETA